MTSILVLAPATRPRRHLFHPEAPRPLRIDRSRITDDKGRQVRVERVSPRGPGEVAATRAGRRLPEAEPPLRSTADLKRKLDELSSRVRRLAPPMASNPERFHEERSEIAAELQRLAERV